MAQIIKKGPSYMVRITWYDADGKQRKKSKFGFKTKVQARQYANKMELQKSISGISTDTRTLFPFCLHGLWEAI